MGACCAKGGGYEGDYYYRNVVVINSDYYYYYYDDDGPNYDQPRRSRNSRSYDTPRVSKGVINPSRMSTTAKAQHQANIGRMRNEAKRRESMAMLKDLTRASRSMHKEQWMMT